MKISELITDDPRKQVWTLLRLFLDEHHAMEEIYRIHSLERPKQKENVRKQARQIGYCIRQAEEYFTASSDVGLPTRPLLLYYGAMSLSQALSLLKMDGKHSLDALRKERKHNHHGLDLSGSVAMVKADCSVTDFFQLIQCELHTKPSSGSIPQPWGHFPRFYQSLLMHDCFLMPVRKRRSYSDTFITTEETRRGPSKRPVDTLIGKTVSALPLLTTLPDLFCMLEEFGIKPDLCRATCWEHRMDHLVAQRDGPPQVYRRDVDVSFALDGVPGVAKERLLASWRGTNPDLRMTQEFGTIIVVNGHCEIAADAPVPLSYLQDIVSDVHGTLFYILAQPDEYIIEPAAMLIRAHSPKVMPPEE